jgi:hypothetical protein
MNKPTDPLAGQGGVMVDLVAGLSDDDLDRFERYWQHEHDKHAARGDGRSAWWCSKHLSIARAERRQRTEQRDQGAT